MLYIIIFLVIFGVALISYQLGKQSERKKNEKILLDLSIAVDNQNIEFENLKRIIEELKQEDFNVEHREIYRGYNINIQWVKGWAFRAHLYDPLSSSYPDNNSYIFTHISKKALILKCKKHIDGLKSMKHLS